MDSLANAIRNHMFFSISRGSYVIKKQHKGDSMSFPDINQWLRQVRALNRAMEMFQEDPSHDREEVLISEIKAYTSAANNNAMEIPRLRRVS